MNGAHIFVGLSLLLTTGCNDFFDAFKPGNGQTLVSVFSTHHATPENGIVPDRGGEGEVRTFDNDEGWTVSLGEGYVITRGVTLHGCNGGEMTVDTYFGSLAEDLSSADLDRLTIGGTEVGAVEFCSMTVHYGPFDALTDEAPGAAGFEALDGATTIFGGWAQKGEDTVPFEFSSSQSLDVHLDLSAMVGGNPVRVTGEEDFPVELTLAKTYDRFFDGIDFGDTTDADMAEQTLALLEQETRVEAE